MLIGLTRLTVIRSDVASRGNDPSSNPGWSIPPRRLLLVFSRILTIGKRLIEGNAVQQEYRSRRGLAIRLKLLAIRFNGKNRALSGDWQNGVGNHPGSYRQVRQ